MRTQRAVEGRRRGKRTGDTIRNLHVRKNMGDISRAGRRREDMNDNINERKRNADVERIA